MLSSASGGHGGAIVIRGEAGIGKTELIERALGQTEGLRWLRAVGREFEIEFPLTGLHELCRPLLPWLEALPDPQRAALEVAFAFSDGATPDQFRVGLAVLGLLSVAAREQPIVCVVDDAQWLDHASARVLAFVARRVEHDPVAFLFAVREPGVPGLLDGLPELTLTGLGNEDALALLTSQMRAPLDERIRDQIIAEAHGNPLALLELPHSVRPAELAGGFGLPQALAVPERIEAGYRDRLTALPQDTQRLLFLAAAEPLGDPVLLWRAAEELGLGTDAAAPAEGALLLDIGVRVRFRHPLVRSAVYRAAPPDDRRAAHRALAGATDPLADPDHRAWHRAQSVLLPDEEIAAELERAADRASARGGVGAAAGFLERATALTPDPTRRAIRALNAAYLKFRAGDYEAAPSLLTTAKAGPLDERHQAFAELVAAEISIAAGPGLKDPAPLLDAARKLQAYDRPMAQHTHLQAYVTAMRAGRLGPPGLLADTARQLAKGRGAAAAESPTPLDLMLGALITRTLRGYPAAIPSLRRAVAAFLTPMEQPENDWSAVAAVMAMDLWEHDHWRAICERQAAVIRRRGQLNALPSVLHLLGYAHILAGAFRDAEALIIEALTLDPTGNPSGPPYADLMLRAWRGNQQQTAALIEQMLGPAHETGEGHYLSVIDSANAVLHNGTGRYDAAFEAAMRAHEDDGLGFSSFIQPELAEAAARSGRHRLAEPVLEHFTEQTNASGTDLAIGLQLYARALLADGNGTGTGTGTGDAAVDAAVGTDADAGVGTEDLYRNAINKLARTHATPYLARAHLIYGEWLRRQRRRQDAREQLRTAHELLSAMGAEAFAARAAQELRATGEQPRKPTTRPADALTVHELHIARLVATGATSKEVAAQLFLSPRTIDAHLRNIFRKLDITSRRQLRNLQLP